MSLKVVLAILCLFMIRKEILRINYAFISNLILIFNYIGLVILTKNSITISVINYILFWFFHNLGFFLSYNVRRYNKAISLKIIHDNFFSFLVYYILLLVIVLFYINFGTSFHALDVLKYRYEVIGQFKGLFSRILFHFFPFFTAIIALHLKSLGKFQLMYLSYLLALLAIFLSGFRGYVVFVLLFFILIHHNGKYKVINKTMLIGSLFFFIALFISTRLLYPQSDYYTSFRLIVDRVLVFNVTGYHLLVDKYIFSSYPKNLTDLGNNLFVYLWGVNGLGYSGSELTYLLPGTTYFLGGYKLSLILGLFIGIISGKLSRSLFDSQSVISKTLCGFILIQLCQLINRGYVINFIKIPLISIGLIFVLLLFITKHNNYSLLKWKKR